MLEWLNDIFRLLVLLSFSTAGAPPVPPPPPGPPVLPSPPPSGASAQFLQVGAMVGNQVMVPTNQLVNPGGQRISFSGRAVDMALSPRGNLLAVVTGGSRLLLYSGSGQLVQQIALTQSPPSFMGLVFTPDGSQVAVAQQSKIGMIPVNGGTQTAISVPSGSLAAGLAFDATGANLFAALNRSNQVAKIAVASNTVSATVPVGVAPVGVAIAPAANRLFVTNWGGRKPNPGDLTAGSSGTYTVVDSRGIASTGSVSVIDLASFTVIKEIPVGLHPSGVQVSPDGRLLAVANTNSDSVTFIDTGSLQVVSTVGIPAYPQGFVGASPTAVAFNSTGQSLYVACGGNNAVAVLTAQNGQYTLQGFIPTDWYPVAVAVSSSDGADTVFAANAKGIGSRGLTPSAEYQVQNFTGTVNIFPASAMNSAAAAAANTPFDGAAPASGAPSNLAQLGIKYVFLIIKENRTYDQVLGDLGQGNGEPKLTLFGRTITPNQHALASAFVTLDNFYVTGTVSADGHHWLTQAAASDYLERSYNASWPRSYPYSGEDALAFASTGFLWNIAQAHGLSARVFGEFAHSTGGGNGTWTRYLQDAQSAQPALSVTATGLIAELNLDGIIDPGYPGFLLNIPDTWRARIFLRRLSQGPPANLTIVQLPADHTSGTTPGEPTPNAMVADNDLAVGTIVEAISKSQYWPNSAIFITEDDAQNGTDHVDGHRSICLVASPFARRGVVDSTQYNHLSILRSIEELLGLPPMNKFDASALPMRSVFTTSPDLTPFPAVPNQVPLTQLNAAVERLKGAERRAALASLKMNFSEPDAAPEKELNRILWHVAKGWSTPYPGTRHRKDCPKDDDD